jgi:hypothetical protein
LNTREWTASAGRHRVDRGRRELPEPDQEAGADRGMADFTSRIPAWQVSSRSTGSISAHRQVDEHGHDPVAEVARDPTRSAGD